MLLYHLVQISSLNIFHHNTELVFFQKRGDILDNVRMVQLFHYLDFSHRVGLLVFEMLDINSLNDVELGVKFTQHFVNSSESSFAELSHRLKHSLVHLMTLHQLCNRWFIYRLTVMYFQDYRPRSHYRTLPSHASLESSPYFSKLTTSYDWRNLSHFKRNNYNTHTDYYRQRSSQKKQVLTERNRRSHSAFKDRSNNRSHQDYFDVRKISLKRKPQDDRDNNYFQDQRILPISRGSSDNKITSYFHKKESQPERRPSPPKVLRPSNLLHEKKKFGIVESKEIKRKENSQKRIQIYPKQIVPRPLQKGRPLQLKEVKRVQSPIFNSYYMRSLSEALQRPYSIDYFEMLFRDHFLQNFQSVKRVRELRELNPPAKLSLAKKDPKKKKTLIFDLDQTLVHCCDPHEPCDVTLKLTLPSGEAIQSRINVRPFASELLQKLDSQFEIMVFTASHSIYANRVIDQLIDPQQKYISHRLYRQHCSQTEQGYFVKDICNLITSYHQQKALGYGSHRQRRLLLFLPSRQRSARPPLLLQQVGQVARVAPGLPAGP